MQPSNPLLGDMRRASIGNGLTRMGIALMGQGPSKYPINALSSLGQAGQEGLLGTQEGAQDWRERHQYFQQQAEQDRAEERRKQQEAAMEKLIPTLPPDVQEFAKAYPDEFAKEYAQTQFAAPEKPPTSVQEYEYEQKNPAFAARRTELEKAKAPKTSIDLRRTEGERSGDVVLSSIQPDLDIVNKNFDSLADTTSQVGSMVESMGGGAVGRAMQTPEYQTTHDAMGNIIQGFMIATSGLTVTEPELQRRIKGVMPAAGDSPERLAGKRARLNAYIEGIRAKAGPNTPVGKDNGTSEYTWSPDGGLQPK